MTARDINAGDIANALNASRIIGDSSQKVSKAVPLPIANDDPSVLFWCADRNLEKLRTVRSGVVICGHLTPESLMSPGSVYILVPNPRLAFQEVLRRFFAEPPEIEGVARSAVIHNSAKVDPTVSIGEHVVIERDVIVGGKTVIGHNTVIKRSTIIGDSVVIGANCTIGGVGFGYEKDMKGEYSVLPHIGNVVVENNVEIGNNTAIDRAVIGSTVLRRNSKIDNLVHIAHGVEVGENSLVIANAMVAGSVVIGKNVWVAPSASVLNQKTIGDGALIGMGAVVLKDVKAGETIIGNPGRMLERGEK